MDWRSLDNSGDLEQLISASHQSPKAIFKHSTRCAISSMAKMRLEISWERHNPSVPVYLLDLLKHRELSAEIAQNFNVRHESPQLIVVHWGDVVCHSSHLSISSSTVAKKLDQ